LRPNSAGNNPLMPNNLAWHAAWELQSLVMAGIPPAEAIIDATSVAARALRLNQLGTVATGKSADFIVLEANPLDDITNTRKIRDVYLRGEKVDRSAY